MSITTKELTDMRAAADDFLPDTCTIQTRTTTHDALGAISESYANTYILVACRIDPTTGSEAVVNSAVEAMSQWMLNIPYDQAISVTDRVVHSSVTYEVRQVMDTHSYSTIRRALLTRVN